MAANKAFLLPLAVQVISGEVPKERKEETVSSAACMAAHISGVHSFLKSSCKEREWPCGFYFLFFRI